MVYVPTNWQSSPSTTTPINAANLNHLELGVDDVDARVAVLEASGLTVQNQGSALTKRIVLNFAGSGVTTTDDSANSRTVVTIPGGTTQTSFTVRATNPGGYQLYLSGLADSPMDGVSLANNDLVYYWHQNVPGDSGVWVVNSGGAWSKYSGMSVGKTFPSGLLIHINEGAQKGGTTYITKPRSGAATYTIANWPSGEIIDIDEIVSSAAPSQTALSTSGGTFFISPIGNKYFYCQLTADAVIAFSETTDNSAKEFFLVIEQDSTGGRKVLWAPRTIAWAGGTEPFVDTGPGAVTMIRGVWLGTNYGLYAEMVGAGQYMRRIPDPWKGVTLGFPMYAMRKTTTATIDNVINTLNRWTSLANRQRLATNGGFMQWTEGYDTDTPVGAPYRGSAFDYQGGFSTTGSTVGANALPGLDATLHEFYHMEHNFTVPPTGWTDPGGGTGGKYDPYTTSAPGYTPPISGVLQHPVVLNCWHRAYNAVSTRTVTGCSFTSGSPVVTTTSSFVTNPGNYENYDGSVNSAGTPYVLAGISLAGVIPAPTRNVTSCGTTLGFQYITFPSGQFTSADIGAGVSGMGIPASAGVVAVDTVNNRVTINRLCTATGTITITVTSQTRVNAVNSSTQITMSANALSTATNQTVSVIYPSGNNSALAEWWSQMRTGKKVNAVDANLFSTQTVVAGRGSDAANVITDFEDFITHLGIPGG